MTEAKILVRTAFDLEIPEPWEVVEVTQDGAEEVVGRLPTEDKAHARASAHAETRALPG